jgi:Recombinase zinc beta ribbon domain
MGLTDALRTIEEIESRGGEVIAVAENFDARTPEGELGRNVFLSLAHMQLRRYSDAFAVSKRSAVERGVWPVAKIPLGYRCHRIKDGGTGVLEPEPAAARVVLRAFERRVGGAAWSQVADVLGTGVSGAQRLLRNRVYLGEIRLKVNGEEVVNPTAHLAIVPLELWEAAQALQPRPPRGAAKSPALLAGLIRCAGCGRTMTFDAGAGYRCHARNASGRCKAPAIIAPATVEPYVQAAALELLGGLHFRAVAENATAAVKVLRTAEAELEAFQQATSALADADLFATGMRQRVLAVESARGEVAATASLRPVALPKGDLEGLWPTLTVQQRAHVLRGVLGVVWVRKGRGLPVAERVRVIARGHEPADLSRPGSGPIRPVGPVEWPEGDLEGEIRPNLAEHVA